MKALTVVIIASLVFCAPPSFSFEYDEATTTSQDVANLLILAKKGDAEAQYNLANAYLKGEGVEKNEKEAAKWFEKSANQDYADAQMAMGFVYRGGGARPMNKVLSYMWFDLAAKNGDDGAYELRNDVAWSMTESEIDEAREKSHKWKPGQEVSDEENNN